MNSGSDRLNNEVWLELSEEEEGISDSVVAVVASKLSESFGDIEPAIAEEAKFVVEGRALDFAEFNEVQLWEGSIDEVEKGTIAEDEAAPDGSSEEEE